MRTIQSVDRSVDRSLFCSRAKKCNAGRWKPEKKRTRRYDYSEERDREREGGGETGRRGIKRCRGTAGGRRPREYRGEGGWPRIKRWRRKRGGGGGGRGRLSSLFIQYSTKVHSIHPYTLAHETPRDVCKWLVTNDLVIPVAPLAPGRRVRSGIIRCHASFWTRAPAFPLYVVVARCVRARASRSARSSLSA